MLGIFKGSLTLKKLVSIGGVKTGVTLGFVVDVVKLVWQLDLLLKLEFLIRQVLVKNLEHVEVTFYFLNSDKLLSANLLYDFEVGYVERVLALLELQQRFEGLFVFYYVPRLGVYGLKLRFLVLERRIQVLVTVDFFPFNH